MPDRADDDLLDQALLAATDSYDAMGEMALIGLFDWRAATPADVGALAGKTVSVVRNVDDSYVTVFTDHSAMRAWVVNPIDADVVLHVGQRTS